MTHRELVEAGYLGAEEGSWSPYAPEKRVLTVTRTVAGEEQTVRYIFRPTLYTEGTGVQVLTEITVPYPAEGDDFYEKARAQGAALLADWAALNGRFAVYTGRYTLPLAAFAVDCWEFLYWEGRPEDLEEVSGSRATT